MSKKLWHPTSGALLAGCLLATAAHAQTAPITPVNEPDVAPATAAPAAAQAPVPQRIAPPSREISTLGLDLQFSDITVKELLKTLSQSFGINISVDESVDGVISYINLSNNTPLEALKTVIDTRRDLSLRQTSNGNYIVSKRQAGDEMMGNSMLQSISPANGMNGNSPFDFSLPGVTSGRANVAPFSAAQTFNPGFAGQGALPPIGQQMSSNPLLNDLPDLVTANTRTGKTRKVSYRIKNIPSSFLAYQLDPANNPVPIQILQAQGGARAYTNNSNATNALAGDGFDGTAGFNTFNQSDFAQTRANPLSAKLGFEPDAPRNARQLPVWRRPGPGRARRSRRQSRWSRWRPRPKWWWRWQLQPARWHRASRLGRSAERVVGGLRRWQR